MAFYREVDKCNVTIRSSLRSLSLTCLCPIILYAINAFYIFLADVIKWVVYIACSPLWDIMSFFFFSVFQYGLFKLTLSWVFIDFVLNEIMYHGSCQPWVRIVLVCLMILYHSLNLISRMYSFISRFLLIFNSKCYMA